LSLIPRYSSKTLLRQKYRIATDEDLDTGHLYTIKTRVYDPKYLARNEARVMNFRFKIGLLKVYH